MKFVWQNVGIRYKVELRSSKSLLHLDDVVAESVLASDLITLWEMIDPLKLVKTFIKVALTR